MRYLIFILLSFASVSSFAASKGGNDKAKPHLRLFGGLHTLDPKDVTAYTDAQNIEKFDSSIMYGFEIGHPVLGGTSLGVRYQAEEETLGTKGVTPFSRQMGARQELIFAMLRIPVVAEPFIRFDVFGGGGVASAKFETYPAGPITNKFGDSTFGSMAGASVAIGFWDVFLTVEVGQEFLDYREIKASDKDSTAPFTRADLSGTFATVGILFNGLPKWAKDK